MSIIFVPPDQRTSESLSTTETVQKMLEENTQLIQTIFEYQLKGKMAECVEYQKLLHRNVVYLTKLVGLGSNGQVSLAAQATQIGLASGSHVTQMHSLGQGGGMNTVSNHCCQQGNLQIQGPSTTGHQSLLSHHQPLLSVEHSGNFGQMSHGCTGQSSDLLMPQQQRILPQDQSVLLHHSTTLASDSYSLTSLHESGQIMVVQPLSHQDSYHSLAAGQQEYTPQFSEHVVDIPQYTQLMPAASTQQNQPMSNQQIHESSQSYVPYSRQSTMNSPGIDQQQQQGNIDGGENQTEHTRQQDSVLSSVRELKGGIIPKRIDMLHDRAAQYDMPNLADR